MLTHTPTCPHCSYEFDQEETWYSASSGKNEVSTGDGDTSELKCPNLDCQKEFSVICEHVVMFAADEDRL